jgi:hypothetical protein
MLAGSDWLGAPESDSDGAVQYARHTRSPASLRASTRTISNPTNRIVASNSDFDILTP